MQTFVSGKLLNCIYTLFTIDRKNAECMNCMNTEIERACRQRQTCDTAASEACATCASRPAGQLAKSERGYYVLPERFLAARSAGTSGKTETGDFHGLLKTQGYDWISAAYPVRTATGSYNGEVQLHYPRKPGNLTSFMLTNSLIASFVAAIGIALLLIWILSRNITRPIRLLSMAADRVSRGDLTARIVLPGINDAPPGKEVKPLVTDDLTVLVTTMNTMIEKLEKQEHDQKDFISSVSHDLRTPITSIRGFVEGMLDGTIPAERHSHYLEIVKQEAVRLQSLVKTMFDASLLDSERKYDQTVFDINDVIREDVIGLESMLLEKNIGVQTEFLKDDHGRLMAIGDRAAISRVVYNILTNAIKFTPNEGIIALTTRRGSKPRELEVVIEDSGPGIPENETTRIFDRFYKIDKSRKSKGSGLGLFICRTILKGHGQRISVGRSELGGARFVFTLASP